MFQFSLSFCDMEFLLVLFIYIHIRNTVNFCWIVYWFVTLDGFLLLSCMIMKVYRIFSMFIISCNTTTRVSWCCISSMHIVKHRSDWDIDTFITSINYSTSNICMRWFTTHWIWLIVNVIDILTNTNFRLLHTIFNFAHDININQSSWAWLMRIFNIDRYKTAITITIWGSCSKI